MADKLLQCPFCGGEVELVKQKSDKFEFVLVSCKNCDATIGIGGSDNEQKVTEAWNTRSNPWHTGTPPIEEIDEDNQYCYALCFFYDGWWLSDYLFRANHEKGCFETAPRDNEKVSEFKFSDCIYWQKIEPYEASKERE